MNNHLIRSLGFMLIAVIVVVILPMAIRAQTNSLSPLAYIDGSGNVDSAPPGTGSGTAITTDADFKLNQTPTHNYTHLRWSPDGSKLAFQDSAAGTLFIATIGKVPQLIASLVATDYPPAWLPDSSAIAYVVNTQQPADQNTVSMAIQQVAVNGGQPTVVGSFAASQACSGTANDPSSMLYMQETALNGNALTFAWTKGGWLFSASCTGLGLALNNFTNQQVWRIDNVGRVALAPSGTQAAAVLFDQDSKPTSLVKIDLSTGHNEALTTGSAVDQVGWLADESTLLYSSIDGQNVSLWKIALQGTQATQLFTDQGKYIGVITSSTDAQSVVFSFITGGDTPQTQILSVPITGGIANLSSATTIAQGGRPTFVVPPVPPATPTPTATDTDTPMPTTTNTATLPPLPSATATAMCTPSADWTGSYTIRRGDTLSNIAQRTGTTIDSLVAGNCLANASVIYAGQVLRVPGPPPSPTSNVARRIVFQPGASSVTVDGLVTTNGTDHWVIKAQIGQAMTVQLGFSSGQPILVVFGADGTILQSAQVGASSFSATLASTQDYFIDVQGDSTGPISYTLTVTVPPLALVSPAEPVARRIVFPAGATSAVVQGQVAAGGVDRWVLKAIGGQTMIAQLAFTSGQPILVVFGADGTVLQSDHAGASSFSGALPFTEDYIIDVHGDLSGATSYTLLITIPPLP